MIDLSPFSRVPLAHLPTPLHPLDKLSEYLGGPRIWIKRDDCTGLATGGNKSRKLEFLIGDALSKGYNKIITFGALQSNHVRQTLAACAQQGLLCEAILSQRVHPTGPSYEVSGNLLLDEILGGKIHRVADDDEALALLDEINVNEDYYVIPGGGSNTVGALGYIDCAMELSRQLKSECIPRAHIIHATSSGGTLAGLAAGFSSFAGQGGRHSLTAINVFDRDTAQIEKRSKHLLEKLCDFILSVDGEEIPVPKLNIRHEYLGDDYGQPTDAMLEAIGLLAKLEGILVDPVYSGKALAGLIDMLKKSEFEEDTVPVFLHTGGVAGLFAYNHLFN